MKHLLASLLLCISTFVQAATSFGTDLSDLWWNQNESGWGVNVIHEGDILFLTFFVYGPNAAPIWYAASGVQYTGSSGTSLIYSGPLYQSSGPWFGGSSPPNSTSNRQVGTVTMTVTSIESALLTYVVDGVTVQKAISRYTFRNNSLAGSYIGATIGTNSGCVNPTLNGYSENAAIVTITQTASSVTIQAVDQTGSSCTYTGPYVQSGRMGSINGSVACSNGAGGTFQAFEIEVSPQSLTARAVANSNVCNWTGRFGGLRRGN